MDRMKFKETLVKLRKERNLNQQDIADLFNVTVQAVSKWENGDSIPDIITLEKISNFYGLSINELLNGDTLKSGEKTTENIVKNTFDKENKPTAKMNLFKLIWNSSYMFLLLLISFLPFLTIQNQSFNFYNVIFSGNMQLGNYFLLISFLIALSSGIIGIVSSFTTNHLKIETTLSILFNVSSLFIYSAISFDLLNYGIQAGSFLLFILLAVNTYMSICIKKLNDGDNKYVDGKFLLVYRLVFTLLLLINLVISFVVYTNNSSFTGFVFVASILTLVLFVPSAILIILEYKKPSNKGIMISRIILLSSTIVTMFIYLVYQHTLLSFFIVTTYVVNEVIFSFLSKRQSIKTVAGNNESQQSQSR